MSSIWFSDSDNSSDFIETNNFQTYHFGVFNQEPRKIAFKLSRPSAPCFTPNCIKVSKFGKKI